MTPGYVGAPQRQQLREKLRRASGRHRHFNFVSAGVAEDLAYGNLGHYVRKLRERCRQMGGDPLENQFRVVMRELCVDCIAVDIVHPSIPEWHHLLVASVSTAGILLILRPKDGHLLSEKALREQFGNELHRNDLARALVPAQLTGLAPAQFLDLLLTALGETR